MTQVPIGDDIDNVPYLLDKEGVVHLYGKDEARAGRKMGHVTITHRFRPR